MREIFFCYKNIVTKLYILLLIGNIWGNVYFIYSVILAAIVLFNHRENIKRIYEGTENRLSFKK